MIAPVTRQNKIGSERSGLLMFSTLENRLRMDPSYRATPNELAAVGNIVRHGLYLLAGYGSEAASVFEAALMADMVHCLEADAIGQIETAVPR